MKQPGHGLVAGFLACLAASAASGQTFGDDVKFLKQHTKVVVLSDGKTGARVATCPDLQGRVMTSTTRGEGGPSFGWINRELVASSRRDPHFNPYGGEDRFWLGPEGGQFAIFFKKGDPFDLAHWYTPPAIDTEPFEVASQAGDRVSFRKPMSLHNYSGTAFDLRVDRTVRLLAAADAYKDLGLTETSGLEAVAYESENRIENTGKEAWRREAGLLSVWILGMFNPSPATTVVVPFRPGAEASLGPIVNDAYFGKVPADRLVVKERVLFFRGDGKHRSKIGIPPPRATSVLGSYDAGGPVLTLVQFTLPEGATDYVNSMWQIQDRPYGGDVSNSYNDGPPAPGAKPLGPFYELETSSPAAALAPGASLVHRHRTIHLVGDAKALDAAARKALGVGLAEIESAFR
jgi:Family of unknown function (DUF6786)